MINMSFLNFLLVKNLSFGAVYLFEIDVVQDLWDSINNNDYFSLEGLVDVFKQVACLSQLLSWHELSSHING